MNPTILAQVTAAQRQVETERQDASRMPSDDTRIEFGRGQIKATITGENIVSTSIADARPVEGPKLGQEAKSLTKSMPHDPRYAGKAGR